MSFRDQLEKKITADKLTARVARTLRDPDSGVSFDHAAMRQLLVMGPYRHVHERDTDLYVQETPSGDGPIIVLDNGLPIYNTTIEDVLLRKSPTVKEMVSFKNAYKILNDEDVRVSKKVDSLKSVRQTVLDHLDLDYTDQDIEQLATSGHEALERPDDDEVDAILHLFAELLQFKPVPKAFQANAPSTTVMGQVTSKTAGEYEAGPIVIYDSAMNRLMIIEGPLNTLDKQQMEDYQRVINGNAKADISSNAVFDWLQQRVLAATPAVSTAFDNLERIKQ